MNGRLLLALDDYITPKTGTKIFGCASFFDHAAKINPSKYPGSQNIVSIGLLKIVKGRWACLPLAFRFDHMKKTIDAGHVKVRGKTVPFQTKFEDVRKLITQAALDKNFVTVCPKPHKPTQNSFICALLRMAA